MTLPPDPEGMNEARAQWAGEAIEAFKAITGADDDTALKDLLCDLMHLCDREPSRFGHFVEEHADAVTYYRDETAPVQ